MRVWPARITIFVGALLLFAVEPMAGKRLLPGMGGSSSVWLACLLFFQVALLLGYGYADGMARLREVWGGRWVGGVHGGLLLLGVVLLVAGGGDGGWSGGGGGWPVLTVFWRLWVRIGLPFLLLAATGPLLQALLARSEGRVRYGLFGLGNVGSVLGLVLYPAVLEPRLTLGAQERMWAVGFAAWAGVCGWVVWRLAGRERQERQEGQERQERQEGQEGQEGRDSGASWGRGRVWVWFGLSAVGAVQMCAVTEHLTENVAAMPLLWVGPLLVYLVSFALAFDAPRLYRREVVMRLLVVMLASLGYLLSKTDVTLPIALGVGFFLVEMFVACWFCHAELYRLRPEVGSGTPTGFYLAVAGGGAAGTFFVSVLCPVLFRANYDVAIAFAMTAMAALAVTWRGGWGLRMLWGTSSGLGLLLVGLLWNGYRANSMVELRNFYGSLRVKQSFAPVGLAAGSAGAGEAVIQRVLLHGAIEHGMEWFGGEAAERVPRTYYAGDSGVGLAMRMCCGEAGRRRVGVIGLGAGTMAAYGRAGDEFVFYEINPLVERLARELFTYLRDSPARVEVVEGDARVSMGREAPMGFDVLVVDAFSGDAIPVHLLTAEAMRVYRRHLRPGGVLAVHISNQYLDLAPVVGALAREAGMEARLVVTGGMANRGEYTARWVLLTDRPGWFEAPEFAGVADRVPVGERVWTDDYSSLLPVVRWSGR